METEGVIAIIAAVVILGGPMVRLTIDRHFEERACIDKGQVPVMLDGRQIVCVPPEAVYPAQEGGDA